MKTNVLHVLIAVLIAYFLWKVGIVGMMFGVVAGLFHLALLVVLIIAVIAIVRKYLL